MRTVVIAGYHGADLLDIACPAEVLDAANHLGAKQKYEIRLASPDGRPIRCDCGLTLTAPHRLGRTEGPLDTIIVAGGRGHDRAAAGSPPPAGGSHRCAPAPKCWPRPGSSTAGERPPTGTTRARSRDDTRA